MEFSGLVLAGLQCHAKGMSINEKLMMINGNYMFQKITSSYCLFVFFLTCNYHVIDINLETPSFPLKGG